MIVEEESEWQLVSDFKLRLVKPSLTNVGSQQEERLMGVTGGNDLSNVQCKAIQNCHKSPMYNEYMLIKMKKEGLVVSLATRPQ
jgi:hypothetical protein